MMLIYQGGRERDDDGGREEEITVIGCNVSKQHHVTLPMLFTDAQQKAHGRIFYELKLEITILKSH